MNQIQDGPNTYGFGLAFNYAVWTADTRLTMCNVSWNNDYRDVVKFPNRNALDAYIDKAALSGIQIDNAKYAPATRPIRISVPFNKAIQYNYIRATNPAQPIPGGDVAKSFYYFILDVRFIAPQTTEIVVQLDVWQTYGYDVEFGNCYVERGHIGLANGNRMRNYGRDFLTIPEGLDIGSEYRVIETRTEPVMMPFGADEYSVLVASTVDLEADNGTVEDPKIISAKGGTISLLPSGATYYVFKDAASFHQYLTTISNKPWVSQGIVSVTVVPKITRYFDGFTFNADGVPTKAPSTVPANLAHQMYADWRDNIRAKIPARYRGLDKLLTAPYMIIELTTWSGTPIIIKPEAWNNPNAQINERANIVPPNQRIAFMPHRYNADSVNAIEGGDDGGEYLDFASLIGAFPTVAIVNNMAVNYLAANANQIPFHKMNASWEQQRALGASQTSYDQASSAMNMVNEMGITNRDADIYGTIISNDQMRNNAMIGSIGGVAGGASSGMVGGPAGAAIGGVGGLVGGIAGNFQAMNNIDANTKQLAVRNSANLANTNAQLGNSGYLRDTNKSLADWAAKGDYAMAIAGINAKVQDAAYQQPTTSGQIGGDAMNLVHLSTTVSLRWKLIDNSAIATVGEYWLRYGYSVRRFVKLPASLMTHTKFTYWKLTETYLSAASVPEGFKQAIRGIFEKGVTVWTNPDEIGNIDIAANAPLEGIAL